MIILALLLAFLAGIYTHRFLRRTTRSRLVFVGDRGRGPNADGLYRIVDVGGRTAVLTVEAIEDGVERYRQLKDDGRIVD